MAIFCTKCGTVNQDGAGFCDNCGAKLRSPSASMPDIDSTPPPSSDVPPAREQAGAGSINPKKIAYAGAVLATLLVVGSGAVYFVLQPPAATASALLAAVKAGYGKETTDKFKRELCISNIDYSKSTFNAGENDGRTQAWLNALVTAGLYNPPVAINSGGLFAQTLLQYVATPDLEKYRQGGRLCAAKDVEFAEVTDIEKPEEQSLGRNGGPPKVLAVKTKLNLKSMNTAPWMDKPEVREAFLTNTSGWEYKDRALHKQIAETFGLKDNKWITGTAYQLELRKQYENAQRGGNERDLSDDGVTTKSKTPGFGFGLSSIFSPGNPLKGTWRTAEQKGFGNIKIPAGTGPDLTFTSDSMESEGQSTTVDFSVEGKRVKVTPRGQSQSLIFEMEGPDTMLAQAFSMRYERVK